MLPTTLSLPVISLFYGITLNFFSGVAHAASLPTLHDVVNEGYIAPLDSTVTDIGFGYVYDRKVSAAPAEKGATVTAYEIEEVYSVAGVLPVSPTVSGATPSEWSTVATGVVTRTYAMNQGASTLHISALPTVVDFDRVPMRLRGSVKDCTLDIENNRGVCVEEGQVPLLTVFTTDSVTKTSTYTETYTATYTRPLEQMRFLNGASAFTTTSLLSSALICFGVSMGIMMVS
ncbi:hypothetical protein CVT24_004472 [Panaeolus cyanescens]|uniref:Uncharacterized protein n=1 Tax=Panaeolus cyanescens TaxID=181874 RepID=A0A409V9Z2_9AGAR|nr:hypothetical protein CVT24_004472 [Panaeolus cyanescens]